jgi:hypothetical protein
MTDIPAIMSGPMVLALLAGRKRMTRRLAWRDCPNCGGKPGPCDHCADVGCFPSSWQRVKPGDRLYVRENMWINGGYSATDKPNIQNEGRRPAIHMPRTRSRLTLVVTATKIERLCSITNEDALREGIVETGPNEWGVPGTMIRGYAGDGVDGPILAFRSLWWSLHGLGSWEENPDVVAVSFKVHHCNIDQMQAAA